MRHFYEFDSCFLVDNLREIAAGQLFIELISVPVAEIEGPSLSRNESFCVNWKLSEELPMQPEYFS